MATNTLKTRIKHRIDTAANWANLTGPPLKGEFIIYQAEGDIPAKLKIGDGVTTASNLPFVTDVDMNNLSAGVRIPESDTNSLGSATQGIYWSNGRPQLMTYTLGKSVPSNAVFTDTNTKVTSAANHYAPQTDSDSALNIDASSTTAATWGTTSLVTGVNLTRDAKGHVTGMTVDSIQMPADPTYTLPVAKYNTLGGVKPAYTSTGSAVLTTAAATNTTTPTIQKKSTTSSRYYGVEADANGILFVNVPWTGDITGVTAGDGLTGGGTSGGVTLAVGAGSGITVSADAVGHTNSVTADTASEGGAARTLAHGGTFNIPSVTYDTEGHITAKGSTTLTLPSLPSAGTSLGVVKSGGVATIADGVITAVSGAGSADTAGTADKVANSLTIQGNGTGITFDGSAAKTVNIKGSGTVSVSGNTSGVITITGSAHPTSLKNPNALTVNVNGTTTTYDGSSAQSVEITAEKLGLSSAMKFGGIVTSLPSTSTAGTVVLMGNKEYVYDASGNWVELGDEGSHALKTIKVTANAGLTGGGTLASDITIGHSNSVTAGTAQGSSGTLSHGGTFTVPKITYDAYGHITGASTTTYTLPTDSNTHYTANLYLGASSASSNATSAVSNPYLVLRENSTTRNNIQLKGDAGISISGVSGVATIGHTNSVTAATAQGSATGTLSFGGTFTIPTITYDAQGHITGKGTTTLTMPANPNTDTHWTANLITGASASATANAAASDGSVYLNLVENGSVRNSHLIDGTGTVTVSSDANGKITINGSAHPTVNNAKITLEGSNGIYIGSPNSFTLNQSSASTITVEHTNVVTAGTAKGGSGTLTSGGTFTVPSISYDANGHITSATTTTYTLPVGVNAGNITQTTGDFLILDCND